METTIQKLNDSRRLLAAGRQIQRRLDCRILEARILELQEKVREDGDPVAAMVIEELIEELSTFRERITTDY